MATQAEIEAGLSEYGTGMAVTIIRAEVTGGAKDYYYCTGGVDAPGRARWCETTSASSGAEQANEILAALRA